MATRSGAGDEIGQDVEAIRGWSLARTVETIIWNAEAGMVQHEHRPAWVSETLADA